MMSKIYTLKQVQLLSLPLDEAWDFFSNPRNLVTITPASLDFKIISELAEERIFKGQVIAYKVRPLFGISVEWISEITEVEEHRFFVDEQRKGPYKMWNHEHHFKSIKEGTEMTDVVKYELPFGFFGSLGLPIVKQQLNKIFNHRRKVIEELFAKTRRPV